MVLLSGLVWMLAWSKAQAFWEDDMELPPCPICKEGRLLPLSNANEPFSLWICSTPACAYAISKNATGDTYYKGVAAVEVKEKDGKHWTEYSF